MKENQLNKKYRYLLIFTMVVYLYLLLSIVIFKTLESPMDIFTGNHPDYRSVNLIPFQEMWDTNLSAGFNRSSIIGNIILFLPLGILLKLFWAQQKRGSLKSLIMVLLTSFLIESLQYVARIGVSDINDLILNTAGGFIGILISIFLIKVMGSGKAGKIIAVFGFIVAVVMLTMDVILLISN